MIWKRIFIKFSVAVFLAAGAAFLFLPREYFPDFYNPIFMGISSLFSAISVLFFNFIFYPDNSQKKQALLNFQAAGTFILLLNGAGALGLYQLYKIGFQYDKLLHFLTPLIMVLTAAQFFAVYFNWSLKKLIMITVGLTAVIGLGWEIFELFFDYFFKTKTLGFYGKYVIWDSAMDILANLGGILTAVLIFFLKKRIIKVV